MWTIHKYILQIDGIIVIDMPIGSKILDVQNQDNRICMWVIVNTELETEERVFQIIGTGHQLLGRTEKKYIGTVQQGPFVWHVFELGAGQ